MHSQTPSIILREGERGIFFYRYACASLSRRTYLLYPYDWHGGWAYILSSHSRCLYVGVTSDLHGRVWEHKSGVYEGFSKKYRTHYLVYQEFFDDIESAIAREKQLKGWSRAKKIALIEKINRGWEDLAPSFPELGPSA